MPDGKNVEHYGFGVLEPFHPISLPIGENDRHEQQYLRYDVGDAYQRLFEEARVFSRLTKRISSERVLKGYNPDDQAALRAFWTAREIPDPSLDSSSTA